MNCRPGHGEAWPCATCGRLVLGGGSWGIAPTAVCGCFEPKPVAPSPSLHQAFYQAASQTDPRWSARIMADALQLDEIARLGT